MISRKTSYFRTLFGLSLVMICLPVFAQSTESAKTCSDTRSASEIVSASINTWLESDLGKSLEARSDKGELVLSISDPILVNSLVQRADFGKSRITAYDKSLLNAQAKFIKERSIQTETELASKRFDSVPSADAMKLQEEEKAGRLMQLGEKIFSLTEAKIDSALRDEGVSVETIEKIEPSKKLELYRDKVSRGTTSKAFGEIAGLIAVDNIEAVDCKGAAAVATIAVYSDKMRQQAQDISMGKPIVADAEKASEKTLSAIVREEIKSGDIPFIVGLRVLTDQDGFPSLVSYGQWAYIANGTTPQQLERAKLTASNFAEDIARSQMALYLKGSMSLLDKSNISADSKEVATITKNDVTNEQISEIVEEQLRLASSKATIKITGQREIGSWSMDYPGIPGVKIVGKVIAWSPQYADAIRAATGSSKRQAANPAAQQPTQPSNSDATVHQSKRKNNAADF